MRVLNRALTGLVFVYAALVFSQALGVTIFVDDDNTNPTPDGSAGNPYPTIQQAIDAAAPGDVVQVAPGLYNTSATRPIGVPPGCIPPACDEPGAVVFMKDSVDVIGAGPGQAPSTASIIDGGNSATGVVFDQIATATITGFTIRNGRSAYFSSPGGAGILSVNSSPTISNTAITANRTNGTGGGVLQIYGGTATISGNYISGNITTYAGYAEAITTYASGAGIAVWSADALIQGNNISGNSAYTGYTFANGGGVWAYDANVTLDTNTITGNDAKFGGGLFAYRSSLTLVDNIINTNYAQNAQYPDSSSGGGLFLRTSDATITGGSIAYNQTLGSNLYPATGGGIAVAASQLDISGVTIQGNQSEIGGGIGVGVYTSLLLDGVDLLQNTASSKGGAIGLDDGNAFGFSTMASRVTIESGTIVGNTSGTGGGGGIYSTGYSKLEIDGTSLTGNVTAGRGGAIFGYLDQEVITNATIGGAPGVDSNRSQAAAGGRGGGISTRYSILELRDTLVGGNYAENSGLGGGLDLLSTKATITTSTITANNAGRGGGIYADSYLSGYPRWAYFNFGGVTNISNSLVTFNQASGDGGGMLLRELDLSVVTGSTIFGNTADPTGRGGGLHLEFLYNTYMSNNIVAGNTASYGGAGVYYGQYAPVPPPPVNSPVITSNDITGNFPDDWANSFYGSYDPRGVNGNIGQNAGDDPLFVNPGAGDFNLQAGSPAIDTGDNAAVGLAGPDLAGKPRVTDGDGNLGAQVDMGAFEFPGSGNNAPVAIAIARQAFRVGDPFPVIVLDGARSYDPDGDPITFSWSQTGGPPVTLDFTAPSSPARPIISQLGTSRAVVDNTYTMQLPTTAYFDLIVSDGTLSGSARVEVRLGEQAFPGFLDLSGYYLGSDLGLPDPPGDMAISPDGNEIYYLVDAATETARIFRAAIFRDGPTKRIIGFDRFQAFEEVPFARGLGFHPGGTLFAAVDDPNVNSGPTFIPEFIQFPPSGPPVPMNLGGFLCDPGTGPRQCQPAKAVTFVPPGMSGAGSLVFLEDRGIGIIGDPIPNLFFRVDLLDNGDGTFTPTGTPVLIADLTEAWSIIAGVNSLYNAIAFLQSGIGTYLMLSDGSGGGGIEAVQFDPGTGLPVGGVGNETVLFPYDDVPDERNYQGIDVDASTQEVFATNRSAGAGFEPIWPALLSLQVTPEDYDLDGVDDFNDSCVTIPGQGAACQNVPAQTDLSISKTDGLTTVAPGSPVNYTIIVSNGGPNNVIGAQVADTFPADLSNIAWICDATPGSSCSASGAGQVLADVIDLQVGGTVTYQVSTLLNALATGQLSNTATVTAPPETPDSNLTNNTATDLTDILAQADLSITKDNGLIPVVAGLTTTYTITVSNPDAAVANGAQVQDFFDAAIVGVNWTCTSAGGATCTAVGSGDIDDTVNLPGGSSVTYTAVALVDAAATGFLNNLATVFHPDDPNPDNDNAVDSDAINVETDMSVTKDNFQASSVPGDPVTYEIRFLNSGPSDAIGAQVRDTFPAVLAGVTWNCTPTAGSSCPTSGGGDINTTVDLLVDGSATFQATGTIDPAATGTLVNTAQVAPPAGATDPDGTNNTSTDTDALAPVAALSLVKTHTDPFTAGTTDQYTLTASNAGPSQEAGPITINDILPAVMTFAGFSSTDPGWVCGVDVGGFLCTHPGPLDPGASLADVVVSVDVAPDAAGGLNNFAIVSGTTDPGGSAANDPTTIIAIAALSVAKSHIDPFTAGTTDSYVITVGNAGPSQEFGPVTVSDTLPLGMTFATFGSIDPAWACIGTPGGFDCTYAGPVAPGASLADVTVAVDVPSDATGTADNVATATGLTDPTGGSTTDTTNVQAVAALSITKSHADPFTAGTTGTYAITVSNAGPSQEAGPVAVSDTLPLGMTFATFASGDPAWSCVGTAGGFDCAHPGPVGAGASLAVVNVTVDVPADVTGTGDNVATVRGVTDPDGGSTVDTTNVQAVAALSIAKTHTDPFTAGTTGTYAITVGNAGPSQEAGPITVNDTLPLGMTFSTFGSGDPAWSCVGTAGGFDCTHPGPVDPGASLGIVNVTVDVPADVTGTADNAATVAGATDPTGASTTDTTNVQAVAALSIVKTHTDPFTAGTTDTYGISVGNAGPSQEAGPVTVSDTLPLGMTFAGFSSTDGNWGCVGTPGGFDCTHPGPVGPGVFLADVSVTVDVPADSTGTADNVATVTGATDPTGASTTDTTSVQAIAALSITKSHADPFTAGTTGTYAITVSNAGPSQEAGPITVSDTLPLGMTFATFASGDPAWACVGTAGGFDCTYAGPVDSGASLAIVNVTVDVPADSTGTGDNVAAVTGVTDPDGGNTIDTTNVQAVAALSIAKSHADPFTAGTTDTYSITVGNAGPSQEAGPVTVSDTLPLGMTFVAFGSADTAWSCAGTPGGFDCTRPGPVDAGTSLAVVNVTVDVPADSTGTADNVATVTGATDPTGASTNDTTNVQAIAALSISKSHADPFTAGTSGSYAITVGNAGPSQESGPVTVSDTLPLGMTFAAFGSADTAWSCAGTPGGFDCTHPGPVDAGASLAVVNVTVDVPFDATGTADNVATVTGATDPTGASTNDTTNVLAVAALSITKSHADPFTAGTTGTYAITVSNAGPSQEAGPVTVSDTLPLGMTFAGFASADGNWSCAGTPGGFDCTYVGPVDPGASLAVVNVSVDVPADSTGTADNVATVAGTTDPTGGSTNDTTNVQAVAALSIAKSHADPFTAGTTGTYSITVGNAGPSQEAGPVTVSDTLPLGMTFASFASADGNWSCAGTPGGFDCTYVGPVDPGASLAAVDVSVDVPADATGTADNVATVTGATDPTGAATTDTTNVQAVAALSIAKSHADPFTAGTPGQYTVTVANAGPSQEAGPIQVLDSPPFGMFFTGFSSADTSWFCFDNESEIQCDHPGPLAPAASLADVVLTFDVPPDASGTADNVASVTGVTDPTGGVTADTTNVQAVAALSITKSHADPFTAGTTGTYTITVGNAGPSQEAGPVVVSDTLPLGMSFAGFASADGNWGCAGTAGGFDCTHPGPVDPGATLAAVDVAVDVPADSSGTADNAATVTGATDPTGASTNDTTNVQAVAALSISKSHADPFTAGTSDSYAITVGNAGPSQEAGPVTVSDTLPLGMAFAAFGSADTAWACAGTPGGFDCTHPGPVDAGASLAVVNVTVDVPFDATGTADNVATVTGATDPTGASTNDTTNVQAVAALSITKTHADPFTAGTTGTYSITVGNAGPSQEAGPLTVSDTLPLGMTFATFASGDPAWSCAGTPGGFDCTHPGPVDPGTLLAVVDVTVDVPPDATGTADNVATVTGATDPTGASTTDTTNVQAVAALSLTKTHADPFTAGATGTYSITVGNAGPSQEAGPVTVGDTLPLGMTFATFASGDPAWSCAGTPGGFDCTHPGPVDAGASLAVVNVVVDVPSDVTGTADNVATVTGATDPTGASTTDTTNVQAVAALSITKSHADPFTAGTSGSYAITVGNAGPSQEAGPVTVSDTLPLGMTFAAFGSADTAWACAGTPGGFDCTHPGPVDAGASLAVVNVTVDVPFDATGTADNVATVTGATDPTGASTNDSTNVQAVAALSITKTHADPFTAGTTGTYSITVGNAGPSQEAGPLTVSDTLPLGMTFATFASGDPAWSCAGTPGGFDCTHPGPVDPGTLLAVVDVTVDVPPDATGTADNVATVTGATDPTGASTTDTTNVQAVAALSLTKTHADPFTAGATGTYSITVGNAGPSQEAGPITVSDTLPLGMTFATFASGDPAWSCAGTPGGFDCTHPGPVDAGASLAVVNVVVDVPSDVTGTADNVATVTGATDPTGASTTDTTNVQAVAALSITKSHADPFTAGTSGSYAITVGNAGPSQEAGPVTVSDTLPLGMTFAAFGSADTAWACAGTPGGFDCTHPGPVDAGASLAVVNVTVDVPFDATGTADNVATVTGATDPTGASTNDTTNVQAVAALSITKTHADPFTAGTTGTYSITVGNAGPSQEAGPVTVSDTLPLGMTFAGFTSTDADWNCAGTPGGFDCTYVGRIDPGASLDAVDVTVDVPADATGTADNVATVTGATDPTGASTNDTTNVQAVAALSIAKSHADPFTAGTTGQYTVTVSNAGPSQEAGPIVVTDALPLGMTFASFSSGDPGWSCAGTPGGFDCAHPGPLAPASSLTDVVVTVDVPADATGAATNSATVTGSTDPTGSGTLDLTSVVAVAALSITKTHADPFTAGTSDQYTLTVQNAGPSQEVGPISVTDTLPLGMTAVSFTSSDPAWGCSPTAGGFDCTHPGPLGPGASLAGVVMTVDVPSDALGTADNVAAVSGSTDPTGGSTTDSTTVVAVAALSVAKSHADPFTAGISGQYTLTVGNAGPSQEAGPIVIADTLPLGMSFTSFTSGDPAWSCAAVAGGFDCTHPGPLAVGASLADVVVTVDVPVDAVGTADNQAAVTGTTDPTGGSASDPTTVVALASLSIAKSHAGDFTAGTSDQYTLVVSNGGPSQEAGPIDVTDTLPLGMTFVDFTSIDPGWACSAVAGGFTCSHPGPLAPGASLAEVFVSVNVPADALGTADNTASVAGFTDPTGGSAADPTTVVAVAALSVAKSHTDPFTAGTTGQYTVTVSNAGPSQETGPISLTDTLPLGMTAAGFTSGDPSWNCTPTAGGFDCTHPGPLAPGANLADVVVTADVPVDALGTADNVAAVTGFTDPTGGSTTDSTTVVATATLAISKSHADPFTAGVPGQYTLTVSNGGPSQEAGPITFTDNLPLGMAFASFTSADTAWICNLLVGAFSCTHPGPLGPAASLADVVATVNIAPGVTGTEDNTATVTGTTDPVGGSTADSTTVIAVAALSASKTHADPFTAGTSGQYVLTVQNAGPSREAGPIVVSDTLPFGMTFNSFASGDAGWSCGPVGLGFSCTHPGPLAPASSLAAVTVTVDVPPDALGTADNVATVTGATDPTGGSVADPTTVIASADLAMAKTHIGDFEVNVDGVYTLTASNLGPSTAAGPVTVSDTLPAGLTYLSAVGGTAWSCGAAGQDVTCTHTNPAPPGAALPVITLTVGVDMSAVPSVTNVAAVSSPTPDPNPANDAAIDITVVDEDDPPVANAGPDQRGTPLSTITLDGSSSFDPEGQPLTYLWTQTGGSAQVPIATPDQATTTIDVSGVTPTDLLQFTLFVTDGTPGPLVPDTTEVQIVPAPTWHGFRGDDANTGTTSSVGPTAAASAFTMTFPAGVRSSLSFGLLDTMLVGNDDGNLYALNMDGSVRWTFPTGGAVRTTPVVSQAGVIYFGSFDGNLYAVDPNGSPLPGWPVSAGAGNLFRFSSPVVVPGAVPEGTSDIVIAGSSSGVLHAVDAFSGTTVWTFTAGGPIFSSPAYEGGVVVFGANDGVVRALDAIDGSVIWETPVGEEVQSAPAIDAPNGRVYAGADDGVMRAFDMSTGAIVWSFGTGAAITSSAAINGATIVFGSDDNNVYAVDSGSGALVWSFATGLYVRSSPTVDGAGNIYVGSCDENLYALDSNGQEIFRFDVADSLIIASPTVGTDGLVYIGSADNFLYAVGPDPFGGLPEAAPRVDQVTPALAVQGEEVQATLRGAHLFEGMAVDLGPGVEISSRELVSDTEMRFTLSVAPTALVGVRHVKASRPEGLRSTRIDGFEVEFDCRRADMTGDGQVDGLDLVSLAGSFGSDVEAASAIDLDGDRRIDGNDLSLLALRFGRAATTCK